MKKRLISALMAMGLGLSPSLFAADVTFDEYVLGLKQQAKEQGISESIINAAFADIEYIERAVVADKTQPEKTITLDEYIPRAVPDWKVKQAQRLYNKHRKALERIGKQYNVQPRFIVALWGVESNFGKLMGKYDVVEALTTLAYEGRREAFFRKEVMAALEILEQGHISVKEMKGSWAGAMGQPQFMPSSFLTFAVDGNNDGKVDIWNTKEDVFASAANYLHKSGWNDEYTWGRRVEMTKPLSDNLIGTKRNKAKDLGDWQKLGVRKYGKGNLPSVEIDAWLIQPDDKNGRSYLIYENYQTILKWNRSHYFALAVSHLADRIR